nr:aldehyde dehydrogenase family protein [Pseudomonas plecoglossicida]
MSIEHRLNHIAGQLSGNGDVLLNSVDAHTGEPLPYAFHQATSDEVEAAVQAAEAAYPAYCSTSPAQRAAFLDAIANELDALGDDFILHVTRETALPEARIRGERARTSNQLRLFADVVRRGDFLGARIDRALPERTPLPRPDLRQYRIVPIAAPTEEERAQPYLWRFWRHIPARGKFTIFDRSWYGRVLVERVEGFCSPADWMRAYSEINDFEEQLVNAGTVVVKFWLAIDQQTQLERFEEREQIPFKRYKITEDDWRNRDKWDDYVQAVGDMVDRTSTEIAPWTLVEANDKRWARVKVLRTINQALEAAFAKDKK